MYKHLLGFVSLFLFMWQTQQTQARGYDSKKIAVVLSAAHTYLGTTYKWGGNNHSGIDCSGLTKNSFQAAGINIPRNSRAQASFWRGRTVRRHQLQKGDLLFFSSGKYRIGHVGIVSEVKRDRVRFIHSSSDNGGVQYNYLEGSWLRRYVTARRLFEDLEGRSDQKEAQLVAAQQVDEGAFVGAYPETSKRYLSYRDIQRLTPCELKILKNEIYARYGYQFHKNPVMVTYFNSQEWYRNTPKVSHNSAYIYMRYLSPIEKANVNLLSRYEGRCSKLQSY